jgi:hypothetical protein
MHSYRVRTFNRIAIRGTNQPNFAQGLGLRRLLIADQVPWSYGCTDVTTGSMISAGIALGLSALQHMRWSDSPPVGSVPTVGMQQPKDREALTVSDPLESWARSVTEPFNSKVSGIGQQLVASLKDSKLDDLIR